jgi:hypothetical protein
MTKPGDDRSGSIPHLRGAGAGCSSQTRVVK